MDNTDKSLITSDHKNRDTDPSYSRTKHRVENTDKSLDTLDYRNRDMDPNLTHADNIEWKLLTRA